MTDHVARLPTTTMQPCWTDGDEKASVEDVFARVTSGHWFVPDPSTPGCGVVLYVPADRTTDRTERMFVCDRPADHTEEKHRQVVDNAGGETFSWPVGFSWPD